MNILIWLIAVIIAVSAWVNLPDALWEYLFFLRVPLLLGLLLVFFPFIATQLLRSMLRNLFVLRGRWQISFSIISAITAGLAVILVANIVLSNGPARFGIVQWITLPELWQYILAIVLGSPICIAVIILSNEQSVPVFQSKHVKISDSDRWIGAATGVLISIGLLLLVAWVRRWLFAQAALKQGMIQAISFLGKGNIAGYVVQSGNPPQTDLTPGHLTILAFFVVELAVYLVVAYLFQPKPKSRRPEAPALLFVLTLMAIATLFLGTIAFFFDAYRVLPLILLLLASVASYTLFKVDHFFVLRPSQPRIETPSPVSEDFRTALTNRLQHQGEDKTLVLICAQGGGIQAAGWTAQVLMGLQEEIGDDFAQAIGLISSVSGGSVGALYYLDRINPQTHIPTPHDHTVFRSATSDSLDAVGWGLAYPDLWRVIGLPFLAPQLCGRGIAIETDWQGEMTAPNAPTWISDWRTQVLAGAIPIPAFNATIVETGDRFVISPMPFYDFVTAYRNANHLESDHAQDLKLQDFNSLYGSYDMSVVTAARLSASFPYISPVSCPCVVQEKGQIQYPSKGNYHMADGGYFDNSGAFTAAQWLHCLLSSDQNPGVKRAMIVQINPFPDGAASSQATAPENQGWIMGVLGPLLTMFKVRDSTLISRTESEIKLLQQRWAEAANPVDIHYCAVSFPASTQMKAIERQVQQESTTNVRRKKGCTFFFDGNGNYEPPLSWKLTDAEKKAIRLAWQHIATAPDQEVAKIKAQWNAWKQNPL